MSGTSRELNLYLLLLGRGSRGQGGPEAAHRSEVSRMGRKEKERTSEKSLKYQLSQRSKTVKDQRQSKPLQLKLEIKQHKQEIMVVT